MSAASTASSMSPELLKVAERAKREPEKQFYSVAHLIDEAALERAYGQLRKNAAVGVDGITVEQYGQGLEEKLRNLHERMKAGRYRHQPIRRVHIPKEKERPGRLAYRWSRTRWCRGRYGKYGSPAESVGLSRWMVVQEQDGPA